MTISVRDAMLKALLAGAALVFSGLASAGDTPPDFLDRFIWPPAGASSADELHALLATNCHRVRPDERRTHEIRRTATGIEIDIHVVPGNAFCPAVALPDTLVAYPIGRLPTGVHQMTRRIFLDSGDGAPRLLREHSLQFAVSDYPHPGVSGSWYDPTQPGSGVFLNMIADANGNANTQAFLYLLTRTDAGEAAWLGGTGFFADNQVEIPLLPAGAGGEGDATATAVFTYEGCGQARLRVEGDPTLVFPKEEARLVQLTKTGGVSPCAPPPWRPDSLD